MTESSLGPYDILGELGRGAMAVVWRAFDPSIGREVAIKEPKIDDSIAGAARDELVSRFIREARTAGQLNHPGIVTIYHAEVVNEHPVIVMELIEGGTLAELLRKGALPLPAAIGIAEQLLDALDYAHERGVVHRDIKPENVFVTDDGHVKLTDFGIAHVGVGTQLTQAGTLMGTPGYMAPEQVRGEDVDARTDLFSVGVLLYEMLAGANPFCADGAHPTTVMYRVLNESLPDVRESFPSIAKGLAATIGVSTAKDMEQRFGSAAEMRQALLGEVEVAMPAVKRKTKGLLLVAGAGLGLLAAGILASGLSIQSSVEGSLGATSDSAGSGAIVAGDPTQSDVMHDNDPEADADELLAGWVGALQFDETQSAYLQMSQGYRASRSLQQFEEEYGGNWWTNWAYDGVEITSAQGNRVEGYFALRNLQDTRDQSGSRPEFIAIYESGALCLEAIAFNSL